MEHDAVRIVRSTFTHASTTGATNCADAILRGKLPAPAARPLDDFDKDLIREIKEISGQA